MIRLATQDDLDFLDQHDPLLTRTVLVDKIDRGEVYVAETGGQLVGYLDTGAILFPGQAATELVLLKHLPEAGQGHGPTIARQ